MAVRKDVKIVESTGKLYVKELQMNLPNDAWTCWTKDHINGKLDHGRIRR